MTLTAQKHAARALSEFSTGSSLGGAQIGHGSTNHQSPPVTHRGAGAGDYFSDDRHDFYRQGRPSSTATASGDVGSSLKKNVLKEKLFSVFSEMRGKVLYIDPEILKNEN